MAEADETRAFLRFIATFLQSLRRTVEIPFEAQLRQKSTAADLLREILRDIESARLSIAPIRMSSSRDTPQGLSSYLAELTRELKSLCAHSDYAPILKSVRFRMLPEPIRDKSNEGLPRFAEGFSAYDAIQAAIAKVEGFANPPGTSDHQRDLFALRSILPAQKIAPAQFEIRNDRLTIKRSHNAPEDEDKVNIDSARTELQRNGERIIEELQQSNCDRRLLDNIQHLQSQLVAEIDVIKVGLTNIGCEFMCSAFEQELPSAVASMIRAHTRGIQLFVGQFPEWNRFLENAATAHLESDDVFRVKAATEELIGTLKTQPQAIDPEVPKTLAMLSQLLDSPSAAAKRAAFAVLRSMENLISLLFKYGAEFSQKTISKTIDAASSTASKVIVITFLTIALGSATAIGPIATKLPEMSWLQTASEIVKKQLQELTTK